MGILASYVLPHCPVAVKEIARGQERYVNKTVQAFEEVGKQIASLEPDTIVIASPHAESYSDYFQIADGETVTGSFAGYGAPQVRFRFHYDDLLRKEITRIAASRKFPAGYEGAEDSSLDHGTMVPLYFVNRFYSNYKIVRLGLSGLSYLDHYLMGEIIQDAAKSANERVVFIASGDMSHCLAKDGPYGYREEGERYETLLNKNLKSANFGDLLRMDKALITRAKECGHRVFALLAGTLDRKSITTTFYSHEAPFGIGYGVYGYLVNGDDGSRAIGDLYVSKTKLDVEKKKASADGYAKLAYLTLEQYLKHEKDKRVQVPLNLTSDKAAVVVSIFKFGTLRARFGNQVPLEHNLASEIIQATIKAARSDTFFDSIEASELPFLSISVDVLSPLEPIASEKQLDVNKYGVVVKGKEKTGFALPSLPAVDSVEKQIRIAKRDAGISKTERVSLLRFTVSHHE